MPIHRSLVVLSVLMTSSTLWAQDSSAVMAGDDLMRRLEELERKNAALETEVTQLKQADGEEWLTEQRAAEIRSIVADTLADAEVRSSLQGSGATAGWDDGFYLASPDGRFRLNVHGLLQTRFMWNWIRTTPPSLPGSLYDWQTGEENIEAFEIPQAQLWLDGHLFGPGVRYMLRGNFQSSEADALAINNVRAVDGGSGLFTLLDAWIRFDLDNRWSFRAGQFRLPFSREELVDWQYQLATQRSVISYSMGVWYSQGIELGYADDVVRGQVSLSNGGNDNVGGQVNLVGGEEQNRPWIDGTGNWAVTGRIEFKPYGSWEQFRQFTSPDSDPFGMLIGFGAHYQRGQPDFGQNAVVQSQDGTNSWLNLTADASFSFGGLSLFAAGYCSYIDSEAGSIAGTFGNPTFADLGHWTKWGIVMQGGFYIDPKLELFARYELGDFSGGASGVNQLNRLSSQAFPNPGNFYGNEDHLSIMNLGVNWYIDGQDIKWTTQIGYSFNAVSPSWYNWETGWRTSGSSDAFVFQTQLQMLF